MYHIINNAFKNFSLSYRPRIDLVVLNCPKINNALLVRKQMESF